VGRIADELIRLGIIEEMSGSADEAPRHGTRAKAGRPGRVLSLNRSEPRFLGIHLDVSETRFSLMPVFPRRQDQWDLVLPTPGNHEEWARLLCEADRQLKNHDLLGIILCVPGIVDEAAGRVLFSPNLHWTERVLLPATLHERWALPIVMIQELRALALGHKVVKGEDEDFLAVDLGEGVGSAAIVGGRLYASQSPVSGELGHTPVHGNRRSCGCGAIGCIETLISRRGLLRSWTEAETGARPTLEALRSRIQQHGIPEWLAETIDAAGAIIGGALNMMGLRKLIVSGVLNELPESVHQQFESAVLKAALWQRFGEITCSFAPRHHTAGMVAVGLDRLVIPAAAGTSLTHLPGETSSKQPVPSTPQPDGAPRRGARAGHGADLPVEMEDRRRTGSPADPRAGARRH
jgi:predicted NBD/HSP70 family sugar kinase